MGFTFKKKYKEHDSELGSKILVQQGFPLVVLNTIFGLLPVVWRGHRVAYYSCSFPSVYTVLFAIVMMGFSGLFVPIAVSICTTVSSEPTSTDMAIIIARCIHIVGFLLLVIRGRAIAKVMPKIWTLLSIVAQRSSLHAENLKGNRRKLRRFVRICIFVYAMALALKELNIIAMKRSQLVEKFYPYGLITEDWHLPAFFITYLVWDWTTLTHGLVSLLLAFLVTIVGMCIRSLNNEIKGMAEMCEKVPRGRNATKESADFQQVPPLYNNATAVQVPLALNLDELERRFSVIKETYRLLERVMDLLSSAFGASILIEQLIVMGALVSDVYYVYTLIFYRIRGCNPPKVQDDTIYDFILSIQDAIAQLFFFVGLTFAITRTVNEARKTLQLVKQIPYDGVSNPGLRTVVRDFQDDIQSTKIVLTASDYFDVNKGILKTLLGTVVTFVTVLMQFQYQENDFANCGDSVNTTASYLAVTATTIDLD